MQRRLLPFVLLVLSACGQDSPVQTDTQAPTAVLEVRDASGALLASGRVGFGDAFSLDGARSTDAGGGQIVRYTWTLPDGTTVDTQVSTLIVTDVVTVPFPLGSHEFGLTVVDDSGNPSSQARVTVIVTDTQAPTAVLDARDGSGELITDGRVGFGDAFSLDGARSTDAGGGQIVGYEWLLPDGTVLDTEASTLAVTDVASEPYAVGQQVFRLTVVDDSGNESTQAALTVIVVDTQAPTAVLDVRDDSGALVADGRVAFGDAFSLDGARSSDVGGRIARYDWLLPDGTEVRTDVPSLAVTDIVSEPFPLGRHVFGLRVVDDSGNESIQANVTVIVVDTQAPTAVLDVRDAAGALLVSGRVAFGDAFSLDGARSVDAGGGRIARYDWLLPDGTEVRTDVPSLAVTDIVSEPFPLGRHVFGLRVVDDSGNESIQANVTVIVVDTQAPTAVLQILDASGRVSTDGRVRFGDAFSLEGGRSVDSGGGRIVRYEWTMPDGKLFVTDTANLAVTDIVTTPFPIGEHVFGLTVTDDSGNESSQVLVTVTVF